MDTSNLVEANAALADAYKRFQKAQSEADEAQARADALAGEVVERRATLSRTAKALLDGGGIEEALKQFRWAARVDYEEGHVVLRASLRDRANADALALFFGDQDLVWDCVYGDWFVRRDPLCLEASTEDLLAKAEALGLDVSLDALALDVDEANHIVAEADRWLRKEGP